MGTMRHPKHVSETVVKSQVQQIARGETPQVEDAARQSTRRQPDKAPIQVQKPKRK